MKNKRANTNDIEILKDAIEYARENNIFKKGWFVQDLDPMIKNNNIKRFYEVKDRGYAGSVGYVIGKDNTVLLLKHDFNDVNTAMSIVHYYVNNQVIADNYYELYDDEI